MKKIVSKTKPLTNIIISHEDEVVGNACRNCIFKSVLVKESVPFHHRSSNAISETRGFLMSPPESIETKFVSFMSYRIEIKTRGNINYHSACSLVKSLDRNTVIAPFAINNTPRRMVHPGDDAPPYAKYAAPIYETLFKLDPRLGNQVLQENQNQSFLYPFCNSFVMSTKNYAKYYHELTRMVDDAWSAYHFNEKWCGYFSKEFPNREFGMLFERFTALWIGQNEKLNVVSNGWGERYPHLPPNSHFGKLIWKSDEGLIPFAKLPYSEFN